MSTADLLKRLGQPFEEIVHLDFETFYSVEYSLTKLTNEGYVRDPRFQTIGVGVQVGRHGKRVWLEEWEFRAWAKRVDWSKVAVNAHHAQFDAFILAERYDIRPAFIFCTMSMGRALHGLGALEDLGPKYGLGEKGDAIKTGSTKGKRREQMTQRQWRELGEYCKNDVRLGAELLYAMELPPLELWLIDTTIRMFTEPVFAADQTVLAKALVEERVKKAELLKRVVEWAGVDVKAGEDKATIAKQVLGSSDKFAALLETLGVEVPMKPNKKGESIPAFAKDDPGMQGLLEHPREEIRQLAEARLSVKSTIIETRVERLIAIGLRGLVPFYLKIYGAHTHRWSGGDRMNPQNFNRGGSLRDAILAVVGWLLVVVDSGQIEARVLAWFAGEQRLLETFRRNDAKARAYEAELARLIAEGVPEKEAEKRAGDPGDFYSDEGSAYFLKKISKKETPIERQLSKNMILGLGFEMGWGKFSGELLKGMLGSDPVQFTQVEADKFGVDVAAFEVLPFGRRSDGITCGAKVRGLIRTGIRLPYDELLIHCAVAAHFVRRYRSTNSKIKAAWRAAEKVLDVMVAEGPADKVRMRFGCLKVIRHGLVKPSGLVLHYPGLRKRGDGYAYLGGDSGREWVSIYGGKLIENIVQSLARDIVAEQAMRIRADGHKIGTTTHDEVVSVVREELAPQVYQSMLGHLRTPPTWCADLPLNASGGFGRSYGAVK